MYNTDYYVKSEQYMGETSHSLELNYSLKQGRFEIFQIFPEIFKISKKIEIIGTEYIL